MTSTEPRTRGDARPNVAVVGAGTIGLASAWRAARSGCTVTLIDPEPGRAASWAAAGMLAPATEAHYGEEALLDLNLASRRRWPSFAAELGDIGYRETGTVVVARDNDDRAALDDLLAFQRDLGLQVRRLSSREARDLEPGLAPTVRGAVLAEDDHQVDNRALVRALLAACEDEGVVVVHARATEVSTAAGHVDGVGLASGRGVDADAVVVAAGAWSSDLVDLPVRPVKGQLLHLHHPRHGPEAMADPLVARNVRAVGGRPDRPAVYLVPRSDGRLVLGATAEERGFDTAVTAGAVLDLLREAYELLPGLTAYELTETTAGLRPGTPDNAPLIGPAGPDGLVVATGHHRNGILLAPITAEAVVAYLTDGEVPEVARRFVPQRFARTEVAS